MIERQNLTTAGKFLKAHALKGELNAVLDADCDLLDPERPLIVEMDGIPVPFYLQSVRPKGQFGCLLKLEGVDSADDAKPFVNKTIYMLKEDFHEMTEAEEDDGEYADDLVGYTIIDDENGNLGEIKEIDLSTANTLFLLERNGKTLYIPVADEFITDIDNTNRTIHTSLPAGLVDLNS